MEKVNRGEWTPPSDQRPSAVTAPTPTFQVEASHWVHRQKIRAGDPDGRSKTIRDLEWRLSVVMDKFGPRPLDRVDFALADELVIELCEERLAIERAREQGAPLMRTVRNPRTGRAYQARRRGVSNGSIRKAGPPSAPRSSLPASSASRTLSSARCAAARSGTERPARATATTFRAASSSTR
jgi:hypothetical protein